MTPFRSPSDPKNFYNNNYSTFVGTAVDDAGNCFCVERNAMRKSLSAKALVVRYPNPFGVAGAPEILYESTKPLASLLRTQDGALHTVSNDHCHHTNESGSWRKHKVGDKVTQDCQRVAAEIDGVLYLPGRQKLWRREGGVYVSDTLEAPFWLAGSSSDLYLTTRNGLFHNAHGSWTLLRADFIGGDLLNRGDTLLTTAACPDQRKTVMFEGTAATGFKPALDVDAVEDVDDLRPGSEVRIVPALGKVFLSGLRGEWLVEQGRAKRLTIATGWSGSFGNEHVLWVVNGPELLCFNGEDWKVVPRLS